MTQELTPPLGWQGIETLDDGLIDIAEAFNRGQITDYGLAEALIIERNRLLPPPPTEQAAPLPLGGQNGPQVSDDEAAEIDQCLANGQANEGCSSRKGVGK